MVIEILKVIGIQLILPAAFIISLWRAKYTNRLDWLIQVLFTLIFITWLVMAGRWDWLGYYLRFLWIIPTLLAIYLSYRKTRALPFRKPLETNEKISRGINIFLIIIFGLYNVAVFISFSSTSKEEAIELTFPLKDGTYYIAHGGSTTMMNYHNSYDPQAFALDVLALNNYGARANGLYPKDLDKYVIYGDILYSPCSGNVLETEENLPDLTPPEMDPQQPKGNYVAIQCENSDAIIYIAHMQENSITVESGQFIEESQPIGSVGNSGNTSEPHLHIHAEKDGVGVPLKFDGEFLVRNDLVKQKEE
ncbi:M23 family metallopeptidase [Oceanobacillus halophilus]|uniref:M23 family metallopeptidase n=1 Tax=Oceanobacillus halophilus TaxID=930130 RepID=A0A495A208_9BACI|nr:M23 family metallopeptidase [Oceanobacillus halophilus]RKQ33453.1 M23 family metallopeptidase [Oceanobacillus halophilus]